MKNSILNSDVRFLKGVGPKKAELYSKLGIFTVGDLIMHFPRSYIDLTSAKTIAQAEIGETEAVKGYVRQKLPPAMIRRGMTIYRLVFSDFEGSDMTVTIFNSKYAFDKFIEGEEYIIHGRVTGTFFRKEMNSPFAVSLNANTGLIPVYPLTKGLTQNALKKDIAAALKFSEDELSEYLKEEYLDRYGLISYKSALWKIHFPANASEFEEAKSRLSFDEFLRLQLGMAMLRNRNRKTTSVRMKDSDLDSFYSSLPFEPTNAQKRAVSECARDMNGEYPMNRLVQGDVGSGKTAVAAAACYHCVKNGYQAALMAPTEILSNQHYKTLSSFLEPLGVKVGLLTGAMTAKQKRIIREQAQNGIIDILVGTHALVQKDTAFSKLGLVITDEQHRFGVKHRSDLLEKGENPHALVMSATPIPRTLALIIYGDLDISVLDEMPSGRQKIKTYAIPGRKRLDAYGFMKNEIRNGRQCYIVCPMIDENESELASAKAYEKELSEGAFSGIPTGLLHGKMAAAQKEKIMQAFAHGEIKLLISTTVIEVGIDVPNATVILIENAERFGLSQLHQLRGRVGRGEYQSHCILVSDNFSEINKKRLKIMTHTTDGFEIAKYDLEMRGPGDFFGRKQHGLPELKIADMTSDIEILKKSRELAEELIKADPNLTQNAALKQKVDRLFENAYTHGFN